MLLSRTSLSMLALSICLASCRDDALRVSQIQPAEPVPVSINSTPVEPEIPRHVIAISHWDVDGNHVWAVAPACTKNEALQGEARSVGGLAEAYLSNKRLLPPRFHFCVSKIGADRWEAVCIPGRELLNSPVTVIVAAGSVIDHFYSNATDPAAIPDLRPDFPPVPRLPVSPRPLPGTPGNGN